MDQIKKEKKAFYPVPRKQLKVPRKKFRECQKMPENVWQGLIILKNRQKVEVRELGGNAPAFDLS